MHISCTRFLVKYQNINQKNSHKKINHSHYHDKIAETRVGFRMTHAPVLQTNFSFLYKRQECNLASRKTGIKPMMNEAQDTQQNLLNGS